MANPEYVSDQGKTITSKSVNSNQNFESFQSSVSQLSNI